MKKTVFCVFTLMQFVGALNATLIFGSVNNLDEMLNRKSRYNISYYSPNYIEKSASDYYIWQPETLCYFDTNTGREVWRMTNTLGRKNYYHNDIGVAVWSSDGNRLGFYTDRDTNAFEREDRHILMIVNTSGLYLRPVPDSPARCRGHNPYFHWSPQVPDVYYEFGRNYCGVQGLNGYDLYKTTVSDRNVTKKLLLSFPSTKGELILNKTISADGKKVIAMPWDESWWYPATIYPEESAAIDVPEGYTVDRNMDDSWGGTPSSYDRLHNQYYYGDGAWIFIIASGHAWWRIKVLGTAPDGGSRYSFTPPSTFDEQWPENTNNRGIGGTNDPFGCEYWSHFVPDRWGRYALFSSVRRSPIGPGVWDIKDHKWVVQTFAGEGHEGAQHHDWHGFTDWTISTRGPHFDGHYLNDRIYAQKYDEKDSQKTVCYTHTLFNNNGSYVGAGFEYSALPRPAQSPDGTKVAFHSTFLNPKIGDYDDKPDIFWAVVYYPYPPEITAVGTDRGKVQIAFDFRENTDHPRTYTTRGWPDEDSDPPPLPKEIRAFRLWVSKDNANWTPVETVERGADIAWDFATQQLSGTTRYYGITSIEYSGLESHCLSNVWKVTLAADGSITGQGEHVAYPADPGGVTQFYTREPLGPKNVRYAHKKASPVDEDGQYTIEWDEPEGDVMILYYNIYAEDGSIPAVNQSNRIGSIPKGWCHDGKCLWVDLFGNPDGSTRYNVTSVDYQGNESSLTHEGLLTPTNLRVLPDQ